MSEPGTPVATGNASHYVWGDGCDGWHLVRAAGLSVIEERMPPGTAEVRHRHGSSRQFFYVLAGTLVLEIEGTRLTLDARTGCEIPPGHAHQVMNESDGVAEFLVVSQPPAQGDRTPAPAE